ncbi:helix-turn-helix transcriptional regulator [Actinomadura madurae]|uniref:helix-turn-helix transcriptional regulator n=1 Tax=Actinomadura madurae TaxID=1993 RepID=UPI0011BDC336|nr:LuxR C-terminal-related transcriptional regulator [Actinomadura madurae]
MERRRPEVTAMQDGPLGTRDLTRLLTVVEECGRQPDLAAFRETAVDALARHLGYRHATFFAGRTVPALFADRDPVANGLPGHIVRRYVEDAHRVDPFAQRAAAPGYRGRRVVSLDQLDPLGLPGGREYLDSFLFRNGIHAKMVMLLQAPGAAAGIGILSKESGEFRAVDLARVSLLRGHLENLFRLYVRQSARTPVEPRLTSRQAEVADLVASGLTNREIAEALFISTDTVKKHLARAMELTGSANRTQLALTWNRHRADPAGGPGAATTRGA